MKKANKSNCLKWGIRLNNNSIFAEQDMINDIAYGQTWFYPIRFRFGLFSPYFNDSQSDILPLKTFFQFIN